MTLLSKAWTNLLNVAEQSAFRDVCVRQGGCKDAGVTPLDVAKMLEKLVNPALVYVYENGEPIPSSYYTRHINIAGQAIPVVDCVQLDNWLSNGFGLLIEAMDQLFPHLGEAASAVESKMLDHSVNVAAMLSSPGCELYSPHFDMANVLVCQVSGSKHWKFYAEREPSSNYKKLNPAELGPVVQEVLMLPGDVMFVPRYIPHQCETIAPSMHLTADVSWFGATMFDWAQSLMKSSVACAEIPWREGVKMVESSQAERDRVLGEMQSLADRNATEVKVRRSQHLSKFRQRWST